MKRTRLHSPLSVATLAAMLMVGTSFLWAQQPPAAMPPSSEPALSTGRLVLVLPFENHSSQPSIDWMGESVPEVMNLRFEAAGFQSISREDRRYALDHLGLPPDFRPSHASTIRLAQNLDADTVVVGSYNSDGKQLTLTARILDINSLKLDPPVEVQVDLPRLLDGINQLAWRIVRQVNPAYPVAEQTFVAADAKLPLSAFENYARGLVEASPAERIKHLKEAVRIDPAYYPAWLELGRVYFKEQDFASAAAAFGKVPRSDPSALAAALARGLASFYIGNYSQAEEAFTFAETLLPLSEVINNRGVAVSRRGGDAADLYQQAIAADPKDPDYHFNLAVTLARRKDKIGAMREATECLRLHPQDSEAQSLLATLQNPPADTVAGPAEPTATSAASKPTGPLERIKRNDNEAAFRQAAYEIDQMQTMKLEALPPAARATALAASGARSLAAGLLLEAERHFQEALLADPANASAHVGLAQVREKSGDAAAARSQAQESLRLRPNAEAHLVMGRLDLQENHLSSAAGEASQALQLEPKNPGALSLRQALQSRGQQVQ